MSAFVRSRMRVIGECVKTFACIATHVYSSDES